MFFYAADELSVQGRQNLIRKDFCHGLDTGSTGHGKNSIATSHHIFDGCNEFKFTLTSHRILNDFTGIS